MNLICSIFLSFFTVFRPLIPLVDYAVNYRYISEELCVNKKQKNLDCNGKCYLAKQLSKAGESDSSPLHKTKNSGQKLLDIFVLPEIIAVQNTEKIMSSNPIFLYKTAYSYLFLKHIFRPPGFLVFILIYLGNPLSQAFPAARVGLSAHIFF